MGAKSSHTKQQLPKQPSDVYNVRSPVCVQIAPDRATERQHPLTRWHKVTIFANWVECGPSLMSAYQSFVLEYEMRNAL